MRLDYGGCEQCLSATRCSGRHVFLHRQSSRTEATLLIEHVDVLRAVMQKLKAIRPFHIDAMVIMQEE